MHSENFIAAAHDTTPSLSLIKRLFLRKKAGTRGVYGTRSFPADGTI